jgi:hypothetical protein
LTIHPVHGKTSIECKCANDIQSLRYGYFRT